MPTGMLLPPLLRVRRKVSAPNLRLVPFPVAFTFSLLVSRGDDSSPFINGESLVSEPTSLPVLALLAGTALARSRTTHSPIVGISSDVIRDT